jgi:hypothetical protein
MFIIDEKIVILRKKSWKIGTVNTEYTASEVTECRDTALPLRLQAGQGLQENQ